MDWEVFWTEPVDADLEQNETEYKAMVITLGPELEAALSEQAHRQGVAPEVLALNTLRARFLADVLPQPQDEWERKLLGVAKDCGVSLPDWAVRREALYE